MIWILKQGKHILPEEVSLLCVDWPFCVFAILMKRAMEMTKDILVITHDAKTFHGIQDRLVIDHIKNLGVSQQMGR